MGSPRIFVSYSARATVDKERARGLVDELRGEGFDPWWDEDGLELNDDWNETISDQLANCHGAVVLLSPVSVASDFVLHETGYLSIRRRTEPDFPLCSFLCDGLTVDRLSPFLRAIQFGDFQFKPWEMANRAAALNKALAKARENAQIPVTPIAALESVLAGGQYFGAIRSADLRGAAKRLRWDAESYWKPDAAVPRLFIRHLLSISMRQQLDALYELGGNLTPSQVEDSFDWVAPFWIDEHAAAQFAGISRAEPGHRSLVINGRFASFTPAMFARRAQPHKRWNPRAFSIEQHAHVGRAGGIAEQIRQSVLARLALAPDASDKEIRTELEWRSDNQIICSVIVDADEKTCDEIAGLQPLFKEVLFILLTDDRKIVIPEELRDRCEIITPPLGSGTDPRYEEATALRAYRQCMALQGRDE
ncbi:MAG: toll/interleukin-1 receptor domain-containing protein [Chromatiales bacterium]|nr:toll/interleukin-1 receptor domain-containing protein [Chromatiales bacterium]